MPDIKTPDVREIVENWLEEARLFGEPDNHDIKRSCRRYAWHRPMELRAGKRIYYVYSRDISEEGIGLVCRDRLTDATQVELRRDENDPWVPARVAHCTQTVGAYKVGIELTFEF
jgi:hypothetical protein